MNDFSQLNYIELADLRMNAERIRSDRVTQKSDNLQIRRKTRSLDLLMKSLGHSSLAVTSRYLHVQPSECTSKFIELD